MKKIKLSKSRLTAAIILVAILVVGILFPVSGSGAKYATQKSVRGSVSYMMDVSLANKLVADDNGSDAGTYPLVPGTTVEPGAKVTVTSRKAIPAYLFIEVSGDLPDDLALTDDWTKLAGVTGPNGGQVYCYLNRPLEIDVAAPVFKSFELGEVPLTDDYAVSVVAYLVEIRTEGSTPADVFDDDSAETKRMTSAPVTETFEVVTVEAEVKDNYTVKNTGDVGVYVRAKVVLNRVDEAGNIEANGEPLLKEGVTALTVPDGWTEVGEYLYWGGKVAPGGVTDPALDSTKVAEGVTVTVIAEAIQAEGGAAADAWGVTPTETADGVVWTTP